MSKSVLLTLYSLKVSSSHYIESKSVLLTLYIDHTIFLGTRFCPRSLRRYRNLSRREEAARRKWTNAQLEAAAVTEKTRSERLGAALVHFLMPVSYATSHDNISVKNTLK